MRVLTDAVALALKKLPGDHLDQRFAVMPFDEIGDEAKGKKLGAVAADMVVTNLARDHQLALVERAAIAKILQEQAFGQSGAVDDASAAKVGALAGARALVTGVVSDTGGAYQVSVRAVDAESAAILLADSIELPKEELVAFAANAVVLRSKGGALYRSMVAPGWGQAYNGEPGKAVLFGTTTGLAGLSTVGIGIACLYYRTTYPNVGSREEDKGKTAAETAAEASATFELANNLLVATTVAAGITVVAWTWNAVDAYVFGTDVENLDAALAQR